MSRRPSFTDVQIDKLLAEYQTLRRDCATLIESAPDLLQSQEEVAKAAYRAKRERMEVISAELHRLRKKAGHLAE